MGARRIVVGVDGSDGSLRALVWAVGEAHRNGGTVQAVMAYDWPGTEAAMLAGLGPEGERRRSEDILSQAIESARGQFQQVPIETAAVLGDAARKLAEAARNADLLVVGSHGHGRLHNAVLGSVSEGCIRHARCPVVVIPTPRWEPSRHADVVGI